VGAPGADPNRRYGSLGQHLLPDRRCSRRHSVLDCHGRTVVKDNRWISTIINEVIDVGLVIRRVMEPPPTTESLVQGPDIDLTIMNACQPS